MAHSDIFLCGQSYDAMLAAGVCSVITEKKGVVKYFFFLKQLNLQANIHIFLVRSITLMQDLPKQRDLFVQ